MALWKILRSFELNSKIVDLFEAQYTDTCCCVNVDDVMLHWFTVASGVIQGCRIARTKIGVILCIRITVQLQ